MHGLSPGVAEDETLWSVMQKPWPNVEWMLGQRLRRWPNINPTLGVRVAE